MLKSENNFQKFKNQLEKTNFNGNEKQTLSLSGKLILHMENGKQLNFENINLLEQIVIYGSIARTARETGICYPKVWHTINDLNSMSEIPLVAKTAGGRGGGGGTTLTDEGQKILNRYRAIQRAHMNFIRSMEDIFFME